VVGWIFDKRADLLSKPKAEAMKQMGVLLASGLIVGESILAVIFTFIKGSTNDNSPIGFMPDSFATASMWLGGIAFAAVIFFTYRWTEKLAKS